MQKNGQFKLPQIKKIHKESSIHLNKTTSDNNYTPKLRPSSSNKVEDLQKKLFNKLQAYDNISKKKIAKKMGKLGKDPSAQFNIVQGQDGFQKMQKLMPALYSKLVQTKKGSSLSENLISDIQMYPSQKKLQSKKQHSEENTAIKVVAEFQSEPSESKEEEEMSQQEMDKIFKEYSLLEGLAPETTSKDMKQLNDSINNCEIDIQKIRKSMEGLIHQIGMQYINQLQNDSQYDFPN